MKRQVRVQVEFVATLDDDGLDVPIIEDVNGKIASIAALLVPTALSNPTNHKLKIGFTRESSVAVRRALKSEFVVIP